MSGRGEVDRALAMFADGASARAAAAATGVGTETLRRHAIARHGRDWWDARARPHNVAPGDAIDRGLRLIADGQTLARAAESAGVNQTTLRRHGIERHGEDWWREHVRRGGGPTDPGAVDRAVDLIASGTSATAAARTAGVDPSVLRRHAVDRHGEDWWREHVTDPGAPSDADVDAALDRIEAGSTARDAAASAGVTPDALRRHGIERRGRDWWDAHVATYRPPPRTTDEMDAAVDAFRRDGITAAAALLGTSKQGAYGVLRRHLGDDAYRRLVQPTGRAADEVAGGAPAALLEALVRAGAPVGAAADKVGIRRADAYRTLKRRLPPDEYRELVGRR